MTNVFSQILKSGYVDNIYDCYIDDDNYVIYVYSKVYDKNSIEIVYNFKITFLELRDFYQNGNVNINYIKLNENSYIIIDKNNEIIVPKKFMDDSYEVLSKLWDDD